MPRADNFCAVVIEDNPVPTADQSAWCERRRRLARAGSDAGHCSRYRLRKQVVEPVFGQVKEARGFRQFLLRGIEKVKAEWAMICTVHNLRKLALAAA